MEKRRFLISTLSLCIASSFAVAGDYKPALALNAKQMDEVTAGFDASSDAFAFAAGLLNASNAQTAAFVANAGDEGTFLVSVGGGKQPAIIQAQARQRQQTRAAFLPIPIIFPWTIKAVL